MKLRFLVLVLIGLMATSTFAATIGAWIQDPCEWRVDGNWTEAWLWKTSSNNRPPDIGTAGTSDEIKLNGVTSGRDRKVTSTIDTDLPNYNGKLTVAGGTDDANVRTVLIKDGAQVDTGQFQVGHGNSSGTGWWGTALQTGGTVSAEKLMVSIYGTRGRAVGQYTISGGTLQTNKGIAASTGRLMVGAGTTTGGTTANSEGTFTIVGAAATIDMNALYVGGYSTYVGTGTIEYKVKSAGVSKIKVDQLISLSADGVANLKVAMCQRYIGDIVLVENTGTSAVSGTFDSINGVAGAADLTEFDVGYYHFILTYFYDASTGAHTGGNDIALIPEPATIALLGLGLIAIRRKK